MAGSNVTFAAIWTQLGLAITKVVNETEKYGSSNSPNVYDMEDAVVTGLDGEFTPAAVNFVRSIRSALAPTITQARLRAALQPFWDEMSRAIGSQLNAPTGLQQVAELIDYMSVTSSDSLNSRGMTLNAVGSITGTGNGTINRLTVDKHWNTLECVSAEAKRARVISDQNQAQEHAEVWEFKGAPAERDALFFAGSGINAPMSTANAQTSQRWAQNPSFEANDGTNDGDVPGSTTAVTGWTLSATAAFQLATGASKVYRGYPGEPSTLWSLEFVDNGNADQIVQDQQPGTRWEPNTPYYCQIAWNRQTTADGTLTLELGSQTASVAVTSGTNGVWNILRIAVGTKNWYSNFQEADLNVKVTLASNTTGSVLVDDLIVAPYQLMDGTYYLPVGGSTAFLRDDLFSWSDTDGGTRAINSYWLWRAFGGPVLGRWFPTNNAAAETIADPS